MDINDISLASKMRLLTGQHINVLDDMPNERLMELDNIFLDDDGLVKVLPAEIYRAVCTPEELKLWCHLRAVYQLPTTELIDFISNHIEGKAIEIGSGNGSIGRALNIPMTDSKLQEVDEIKTYYTACGQPIVEYPKDIIHMEANKAINRFKPNTVIACWVTEWSKNPSKKTSYWGVDEINVLYGKKYILVGNSDIHGDKKILQFKHEVFQYPWILSRATNQNNNMIWIWDKTIR